MESYIQSLTQRGFKKLQSNVGRHNAGVYLNIKEKRAVKIVSHSITASYNSFGPLKSFKNSFFSHPNLERNYAINFDMLKSIWASKDLQAAKEKIKKIIINFKL